MDLSYNETKIMAYLEGMSDFVSPTEIGFGCGGLTSSGRPRHSSWASPICMRLVKKGLLVRSDHGWYKPRG